MRLVLAACMVLVLAAGCLAPAATVAPESADATAWPTAPGLHEIEISINDTTATGVWGVPEAPSTTLVVFAHWFGGLPEDTRAVAEVLVGLGTYVVAMDYRAAPTTPTSPIMAPWNVEAGAEETLAATSLALEQGSFDLVIAHGFSMGGEVSGMVIARAPPGTFDYWIQGAGVMDLADEWTKEPQFRPDIEAETGGPPLLAPEAYATRSPLALVPVIAAHGLTRAYFVHATADPIVPFGQAVAMADALREAGVPLSLYEAQLNDGVGLCQPACDAIPLGPAGHEAGLFPVFPLVEHRIQRLGDLEEPFVRGTYDGRTATFEPSDVPG